MYWSLQARKTILVVFFYYPSPKKGGGGQTIWREIVKFSWRRGNKNIKFQYQSLALKYGNQY